MSVKMIEEDARRAVNRWMAGNISLLWIPGSSLVLGTTDLSMIRSVARIFQVTDYDLAEIIAAATGESSASQVGESSASQVRVFAFSSLWSIAIPGPSWASLSTLGGNIAARLGEAVIAYLRDQSPLLRQAEEEH